MTRIVAKFQTVTPIFMGGSDSKDLVERLRPPSFKGALRFWWRALRWSPIADRFDGDTAAALRALHVEEGALFGHAGSGGRGCQGRVAIRLTSGPLKPWKLILNDKTGPSYLLGQDLAKRRHGLDGEFSANLRFHPATTDGQVESVRSALWALGLLGGLGARVRRGIGSIALRSLDDQSGPADEGAYRERLAAILPEPSPHEPPFSAFWRDSRIDISLRGGNVRHLLNEVDQHFCDYRKGAYPVDKHLALQVLDGEQPERAPARIAFGLPHNYYFKPIGKQSGKSVTVEPRTAGRERRASPLLLHVHGLPADRQSMFLAVHCHLPCTFLPAGEMVRMVPGKSKRGFDVDPHHEPTVIPTYLDTFTGRTRIL